jgi:bifunctional UDP-N-acetylglucosamine pyrophosphorylase/glucosamine-1-phosphate N-acetyltransferase
MEPERIVLVLGHDSELVKESVSDYPLETVIQEPQLGTGHAVSCCEEVLRDFSGDILILSGDVPATDVSALREFADSHAKNGADVSFISTLVENPSGYGRVLRNAEGEVLRIVEDKDATADEKGEKEINAGIYCVNSSFLWESLGGLDRENSQGEYYLPGIVDFCVSRKGRLLAFNLADPKEVSGVNSREQLGEAEKTIRLAINRRHMENGVTIVDPETTYISDSVSIGKDTTVYPNTYVYGETSIGEGCRIGPSVYIEDSRIGNNVEIRFSSYLAECEVENDVVMGPFCHLRPEAKIKDGAKIGNFVEIKKSNIGVGSKVPHLSYVGDADIGDGVNIGAGTITCNYDGVDKHRTVVEDGAFIGSDTMLVAPIKVGKDATTAAGSTVTKDVSPGALAIERAAQKEIEGWAERKRVKKGKS